MRKILPDALEVGIGERFRPVRAGRSLGTGTARSPRELFLGYLSATGREDDQVEKLFNRLYDDVTG